MHFTTTLLTLAATALAIPYFEDGTTAPKSISITIPGSTLTTIPSTSLYIPITPSPSLPTGFAGNASGNLTSSWSSVRTRYNHTEPIPIFSRSCDCPDLATMQYPCWATDSLQRCNFEELHSFVCWTSAARGCPTPTRVCSSLFEPTSVSVTGKHPCDIGGNPSKPTDAPTNMTTADQSTITSPPNGALAL